MRKEIVVEASHAMTGRMVESGMPVEHVIERARREVRKQVRDRGLAQLEPVQVEVVVRATARASE